jgi:hypothetical protein
VCVCVCVCVCGPLKPITLLSGAHSFGSYLYGNQLTFLHPRQFEGMSLRNLCVSCVLFTCGGALACWPRMCWHNNHSILSVIRALFEDCKVHVSIPRSCMHAGGLAQTG